MEKSLSVRVARRVASVLPHENSGGAIATAYNQSGDAYIAYADGDPRQLFAFDGQYAYGDRRIWAVLDAKLCALRATGAQSVCILDLGCGPGTWLRRIVTRARTLGFTAIAARGFDIADGQVKRARELAANLSDLSGISLSFEIADICAPFREADGSVDLCLCLCGVLNHLPAAALATVFGEVARVTRGYFVTSVRAVGSTPTVYVDAIERARCFQQDNRSNWLDVEFQNGRRVSLRSHLYSAAELRSLVGAHLDIEDLSGLDLFHGRFAGDPRWNPLEVRVNEKLAGLLDRLEADYARNSEFIDHATHLLLVARCKRKAASSEPS